MINRCNLELAINLTRAALKEPHIINRYNLELAINLTRAALKEPYMINRCNLELAINLTRAALKEPYMINRCNLELAINLTRAALKEPYMNNPRCNRGPVTTQAGSALKELNKNYGKNLSSILTPDSSKSFLYSSSKVFLE